MLSFVNLIKIKQLKHFLNSKNQIRYLIIIIISDIKVNKENLQIRLFKEKINLLLNYKINSQKRKFRCHYIA